MVLALFEGGLLIVKSPSKKSTSFNMVIFIPVKIQNAGKNVVRRISFIRV